MNLNVKRNIKVKYEKRGFLHYVATIINRLRR